MKKRLLFLAISLLAILGCSKEENAGPESQNDTIVFKTVCELPNNIPEGFYVKNEVNSLQIYLADINGRDPYTLGNPGEMGFVGDRAHEYLGKGNYFVVQPIIEVTNGKGLWMRVKADPISGWLQPGLNQIVLSSSVYGDPVSERPQIDLDLIDLEPASDDTDYED